MRELEASSDKILQIGYEGEDNVTTIKFLYDEEWLSHGNGEFKVRVLRNGDTEAYNATQIVDDRENMTLTMTVTDIEFSKKVVVNYSLFMFVPERLRSLRFTGITSTERLIQKWSIRHKEALLMNLRRALATCRS